jgi:cobalt-zinc-cadmium efflux system membrane fusion protein
VRAKLLSALVGLGLLGVVTTDCSRRTGTPSGHDDAGAVAQGSEGERHRDEAEHEAMPRRVRLSADVVTAAGIRTSPVLAESLPLTVDLSGQTAADPDRSAEVAIRAPGRIVDVRFQEGQLVKKGELLALVDSPAIGQARASLVAARARAQSARQNAGRLESLRKDGLAAGQEVSAARAEAESLEAEAASAGQTLLALGASAGTGARLEVRAPLDGFVLSRTAVRGQTVEAEHVLAAIADLGEAYFVGRLFEKDLAKVQVGAAADVTLNAYPGEVFPGVVESVGKQLDTAARAVVARIRVKDHGDLFKVGLFGSARVNQSTGTNLPQRPVVPIGAVTQLAGQEVVFVRQPDGDYEVHPVKLGNSAGGKVEVLSGLRAGEQVVVDGAFTLKSTVLKSSFGQEE